MGLKTSRQFRRWSRGVLRVALRVTFNAVLASVVAFILHDLLRGRSSKIFQLPFHDTIETSHTNQVEEALLRQDENATIWQVMLQDPSLQRFVDLNMPFSDIKGHLDNASEIYTVYAPIDSAFEGPLRHPVDPPNFYAKFFSLNHMGPGKVSHEDLQASTTVANSLNHDVYFKNLQRISTKSKQGSMVVNHVANYVGRPLVSSRICK